MKKFIRFFMRDRRLDITLSMEQAEKILLSPQQLVMIHDEAGEWTGITINKAEILGTDHDFDSEKAENWKVMRDRALPEPEYKPIADIEKFKPDFLKKQDDLP